MENHLKLIKHVTKIESKWGPSGVQDLPGSHLNTESRKKPKRCHIYRNMGGPWGTLGHTFSLFLGIIFLMTFWEASGYHFASILVPFWLPFWMYFYWFFRTCRFSENWAPAAAGAQFLRVQGYQFWCIFAIIFEVGSWKPLRTVF